MALPACERDQTASRHEVRRTAETKLYMWLCRRGRDGSSIALSNYEETEFGGAQLQLIFSCLREAHSYYTNSIVSRGGVYGIHRGS